MDDAFVVRGFECVGDLLGIVEHGVQRHRSFDRFVLYQLHVEGPIFDAIDLRDVGMIQRRENLGFAQLIRYFAVMSMFHGMSKLGRRMSLSELCTEMPQMVPAAIDYVRATRVVEVLWTGDSTLSQRQACLDINWLIGALGGAGDVVTTETPDAPAAPDFGMHHILIASAVMDEEVTLTTYQLPPDRIQRLLLVDERDYSLYFMLRDFLSDRLGAVILGLLTTRMALDACVTGILYPQPNGPIAYHNFHPSFRLMEFQRLMLGLHDNKPVEGAADLCTFLFTRHSNLSALYETVSEFASTYGKCPMFVKMDGAKALRSFDELVSRFAPDNITSTIVKISGRPLISYWLDSYGRVCRDRETYPELFIYPNANSTVDDALRPDLFTDPCAASTMLPGKGVESVSLLRSLKLDRARGIRQTRIGHECNRIAVQDGGHVRCPRRYTFRCGYCTHQ